MNERQKLILKIMHLGFMVHELTDYCVFVRFAGHVDSCEIDIRESKDNWQTEVLTTDFKTIFKDKVLSNEKQAYLKAKIAILEQILEDGEIDLDPLDYETETTYKYFF